MSRCPIHSLPLVCKTTRYGKRWACPQTGCTVVRWEGETSTPADAETRAARQKAHVAFDALWAGAGASMTRDEAYRWLADLMGVFQNRAHIGMADRETCERIVREAKGPGHD